MAEDHRGRVRIEAGRKRVRAYLDGHLVADTRRPHLVWEIPYYPTYYVPAADVVATLTPNGKTEHSPSRGDAELLDVTARPPPPAAPCATRTRPWPSFATWSGWTGRR